MADIKKAAEAAERACQREIAEGVKRCSFPEQNLAGNDLLGWLYKTHPPSLQDKEIIPPIPIAVPGGGSKSKKHKKPTKKQPEYLKTWGV